MMVFQLKALHALIVFLIWPLQELQVAIGTPVQDYLSSTIGVKSSVEPTLEKYLDARPYEWFERYFGC